MTAEYSWGARSPWLAIVLRSIPALTVGLVITFSADHSPQRGLVALAAFGLATAVVLGASGMRLARAEPVRNLLSVLGAIAALVGASSLAAVVSGAASLPILLLLVGGYAVLAGAFELVWGLRLRHRSPLARDAMIIGGATLALAAILALVADPVSAVGFFGAYAIMLGLFLLIAGLSLKWSEPTKETLAS